MNASKLVNNINRSGRKASTRDIIAASVAVSSNYIPTRLSMRPRHEGDVSGNKRVINREIVDDGHVRLHLENGRTIDITVS